VATSISGLAGVSYDSANNRLSLTSDAVSPVIVSRAVASGDALDDLDTWTVTLSAASHGTISVPSATTIIVDPAGAPLNGLSSGASMGFGFDRLNSLYTGPVLRAKLTSGVHINDELDFGFATGTGLLDTSAISAWMGGETAEIVTWYDQTGNGHHATGSGLSLVLGATPNGRPVLRGTGSTGKLRIPGITSVNNVYAGGGYICSAQRFNGPGGTSFGRPWDKKSVTFIRYLDTTHVRFTVRWDNGSNRNWNSVVPTTGAAAWFVYGAEFDRGATSNTPTTRVNGSVSGTSVNAPTGGLALSDAAADTTGDWIIGNTDDGTNGLDGDVMNFIVWQDKPTAPEQASVEAAIIAMNGIT
jgi:hypothetical protein